MMLIVVPIRNNFYRNCYYDACEDDHYQRSIRLFTQEELKAGYIDGLIFDDIFVEQHCESWVYPYAMSKFDRNIMI
jgi:hypothetical protein